MLEKGPARKVTIYVNEDTRHHVGPLYEAVLDLLRRKGVAGATASRALAGFGPGHKLHTSKIEVLSEHLPIRIEFVDSASRVDEVLPALYDLVTDGLIEMQDTTVVKAATRAAPALKQPHEERRGPARLMRVFLGESDRWEGEPLHDAIVKRLRMMDIAGATVYRGILGYGAKGHTHRDRSFHLSRDLPVMISVVDTPEKIAAAAQAVEQMLVDGLLVLSDVEAIRLVRSHGEPHAG
jgi:PII-like signaling protein